MFEFLTFSTKDKWLKFFAGARYIEEKLCQTKPCKYAFSILAHNEYVQIIDSDYFISVVGQKRTGCQWRQLKSFLFVFINLESLVTNVITM